MKYRLFFAVLALGIAILPVRQGSAQEFPYRVFERYLEPLERAQRWRALGIPHLLIRFSDRAVHVGPVVETAGAPCHSCVSLGLVARDAALPLLAMQLHEKVPHSETPVAGEFAAVYAALLIREWRDGARSARTTRWVIPIVHGKPHGPTHQRHDLARRVLGREGHEDGAKVPRSDDVDGRTCDRDPRADAGVEFVA